MRKGKRKKTRKLRRFPKISLIIIIVLALAIVVTYFAFNQPTNPATGEIKAAILDSLYIIDPNADFLNEVNSTLSQAGFKVDIYLGEDVTVELFKELPSLNYKLIILRAHTAWEESSDVKEPPTIAFFTGTPYNGYDYFMEKMFGEVREGTIEGYPTHFFAVTQKLIQVSEGEFPDSFVIVDSCYGLNSNSMAEAFIENGASVYIGWDSGVYSDYSDSATLMLLDNLLSDMTVEDAVSNTIKDHDFGSILSYYPSDKGDLVLK
ncbi:MAG: hypothetical protein L6M37_02080 [Candidatus Methylarchaceae archaeon HK02M1]|nr:hypothetical protein [Candidatus Methylarchaceae archaeon HK01M]MCP8311725.1 hypothetical protein [Candidatus Methylarchaceae archaeon HK02M1]